MDFDFVGALEALLEDAKVRKNAPEKNEGTRHWAVVYTELEKTLAYVKTYLQGE